MVVAGRLRRLDFLYEQQRLVIEAMGYRYHSDPIRREKDRRRRNGLTARGYRVFEWTWDALKEVPGTLIRELALALGDARQAGEGATTGPGVG